MHINRGIDNYTNYVVCGGDKENLMIDIKEVNSTSYSNHFRISLTTSENSYDIKDIYCFNETTRQFELVTNLISPEVFQHLI